MKRYLNWIVSVVLVVFFGVTIAAIALGQPDPVFTAGALTFIDLVIFTAFLALYATARTATRLADAMHLRGVAWRLCGLLLRVLMGLIGFTFFGLAYGVFFRTENNPLQAWGVGLPAILFGTLLLVRSLAPREIDLALADVFQDDRPLRKMWRNLVAHLNRPL